MDRLVEWLSRWLQELTHIFFWRRLAGARIEIVCLIYCRATERILLGKSPYNSMWMPPQEGLDLFEEPMDALARCLEVECGLELPASPNLFERHFYVRAARYLGTLPLPQRRHGERLVADKAVGTILAARKVRKKAYYGAKIVVDSGQIVPKPDGKELLNLRWFSSMEAIDEIRRTNHRDKAGLLARLLGECLEDEKSSAKSDKSGRL